ncbi:Uncharacterised protein [Porphyromonas macacae]|uniref:Uncharacterized protein n=1 Tax=Porphyromonas macacae TaxID=28115 RepID=A0A379EBJ5_9PORP|nr:Uncharacterised protein [Porphyromonas macacae]
MLWSDSNLRIEVINIFMLMVPSILLYKNEIENAGDSERAAVLKDSECYLIWVRWIITSILNTF